MSCAENGETVQVDDPWANPGDYDLTTLGRAPGVRESMVAAAAEPDKISGRVKRGTLRRARNLANGTRSYAMPGYLPRGKDRRPGTRA